jgi:hypothetical protein
MGRRRYSGRHPSRYWGGRRCVHRCRCGCGQRCRLSDTHYGGHAYHDEQHAGERGDERISAVCHLGGRSWAVVVTLGQEGAAVHRDGQPVGEGTWVPGVERVKLDVAGVPELVLRLLESELGRKMRDVEGTQVDR